MNTIFSDLRPRFSCKSTSVNVYHLHQFIPTPIFPLQHIVNIVQHTVHIVQNIVHTVQLIVNIVQHIVKTTFCAHSTAHCAQSTVHCKHMAHIVQYSVISTAHCMHSRARSTGRSAQTGGHCLDCPAAVRWTAPAPRSARCWPTPCAGAAACSSAPPRCCCRRTCRSTPG